jgi:hypothetical protein
VGVGSQPEFKAEIEGKNPWRPGAQFVGLLIPTGDAHVAHSQLLDGGGGALLVVAVAQLIGLGAHDFRFELRNGLSHGHRLFRAISPTRSVMMSRSDSSVAFSFSSHLTMIMATSR